MSDGSSSNPDIHIRKTGRAGRITLTRPKALNALSHAMSLEIERAIDAWRDDPEIALVVIDATGEKAFCAGGDIAGIYHAAKAGDYAMARDFWHDEYRLNAKLFEFPKPVAAFMQGFTMGGGVGIGCHGSHRVVGSSSQMAMPECGIGLVPDVGGTLLLARAPGRLGEYLGTTGARMNAADAIHAGFADYHVPEAEWPALIARLEKSGDWSLIDEATTPPGDSPLAAIQPEIDAHFGGERAQDILTSLQGGSGEVVEKALKAFTRGSPLSVAATVELIHRVRARDDIRYALSQEQRATWRAIDQGDLVEGIRAQIIDKDRQPRWQHQGLAEVPATAVARLLAPLDEKAGEKAINWEEIEP